MKKCPVCPRSWDDNSEQAVCIEMFNECIVCRFGVKGPGSHSGIQEELDKISAEAKRRNTPAEVAEVPEVVPVKKQQEPPSCINCAASMQFVSGHFLENPRRAHNLYHCTCGTICREDVYPERREVWLHPDSVIVSVI